MTREPRTTETATRDHAAMRDIMVQIRERLTVPDRAALAVGLVGHLAALMNRRQITRLMAELQAEAERVQDVPPTRRQERPPEADGTIGAGYRAGDEADVRLD
jgi:hypothetical protein